MTESWTEFSGIHNVRLYTYKELRMATEDFSPANKIGEGGFGSVFKVIQKLFNQMIQALLASLKLISPSFP